VIIDDTYIRVEDRKREKESTRFREARNDQSISPFRASPSREFTGDREPNWQPRKPRESARLARKRAKKRLV